MSKAKAASISYRKPDHHVLVATGHLTSQATGILEGTGPARPDYPSPSYYATMSWWGFRCVKCGMAHSDPKYAHSDDECTVHGVTES